MKIAFIGFGEAASHIAEGLAGEGIRDMSAYDVIALQPEAGAHVRERAAQIGVTLRPQAEHAAADADAVFAAVPGNYALDVCRQLQSSLHEGQLYVDVSASTPAVKRQIADILLPQAVGVVDAAMLGSLPQLKHKVPITASGSGAKRFQEAFTPYGMRIEYAGEEAGAASAIKLIRSIYTKGTTALMLELLLAADTYGVTDQVMDSISKSVDNSTFADFTNRLVPSAALHAKRRAEELAGSAQMLNEAGIDDCMVIAAKEMHEWLADKCGDVPESTRAGLRTYSDVINMLMSKKE